MELRPGGLALACAVSVAVAACVGEKPVDPGDDDDDDDTDTVGVDTAETTSEDDSADTGGEVSAFLEITQLYIDAEVGWDADRAALVDVDAGGFVVAPALYLVLGTEAWRDSGWDFDLEDEYCVMILPLTSSDPAAWVTDDPTVWFGIDYVGGLPAVQTDCGTPGKELDPAVFGKDPVATMVDGYGPWGVGLGEWGPSWSDTWLDYFPDDTTMFDTYVGARVQTTFALDSDDFRAFPVQIDPDTHAAVIEEDLYVGVPPALVLVDGAVATAWYRFHSMWVYGL